jgi:uncharacterized membrane protein (UPF0127 family)
MSTMYNETQKSTLIENLHVANSFKTRAQGLIGTPSLASNEGMWFPKSNWIHTCFMSMTIDVIYIDKNMKVTKLQPRLKPWRLPAPVLKAQSVLEVGEGFIEKSNIQIGDQLHVGH